MKFLSKETYPVYVLEHFTKVFSKEVHVIYNNYYNYNIACVLVLPTCNSYRAISIYTQPCIYNMMCAVSI